MARSLNIADIEPSDGLIENARVKINRNFASILQAMADLSTVRIPDDVRSSASAIIQSEIPGIVSQVTSEVEDAFNDRIGTLSDDIGELGKSVDRLTTDMEGLFDEHYPIGCVISTSSSSDSRLQTGTWEEVPQSALDGVLFYKRTA